MIAHRSSAAIVAFALLGVSCGAHHAPPPPEPVVVPALPAGIDFVARQRIEATFHERTRSFEAVLERHGDRLVVVGLAPYGGRAFDLVQEGAEVHFESHIAMDLPFPPEFVLRDIHRVLFDGTGYPGPARDDGEHVVDDGAIVEVVRSGILRERRFVGVRDGTRVTLATVAFTADDPAAPVPSVAELDDRVHGYRLRIVTLESRRLDPSPRARGDADSSE